MTSGTSSKILRTLVLIGVVGICVLVGDRLLGEESPKVIGYCVAVAAGIFVISDLFFWPLINKLSDLSASSELSSIEIEALSRRVGLQKAALFQRWFVTLFAKVIAGGCSVWLIHQPNPGDASRIVLGIAIVALTVSIPFQMSFFWNWKQADTMRNRFRAQAKRRQEVRELKTQLETTPKAPLSTGKEILAGYTKIASDTQNRDGVNH